MRASPGLSGSQGYAPLNDGLEALFQDMSQVLQQIELVLLQVPLQVTMPMMAVLGTLLMMPLGMMTPLRPAMYCCSMMKPLHGHVFLIFLVFRRHCPLVGQTCIYQTASQLAWTVCIILPLGRLQTCMYYIAPQWVMMYDIASRQALDVCFWISPIGMLYMYVSRFFLLVGS